MVLIVYKGGQQQPRNQRLPLFSLNLADMPYLYMCYNILKALIFLQPAPLFFDTV